MTLSSSSNRNIILDINDDPIAAIEALVEEFGGARKQLYQSIAKALAIAEVLEADAQKWAAFQTYAKEKGFHVAKLPLRSVMCFLFKAKKPAGPAYDRACIYTRAVLQLQNKDDASASNIADLIRDRGGVEELYSEAKSERLEKAKESSNVNGNSEKVELTRPISNFSDEAASDLLSKSSAMTNDSGLSDSDGMKTPPKRSKPESDDEPRKYTKEWCEKRLIIEMSPSKLQTVLNMRHRQRGSLDFAFGGSDDTGFKIYHGDNLELK